MLHLGMLTDQPQGGEVDRLLLRPVEVSLADKSNDAGATARGKIGYKPYTQKGT
jgi:hypothetical protein